MVHVQKKHGVIGDEKYRLHSNDTLEKAVQECEKALKPLGVKACAYFMTPPFHSQVSPKSAVLHFGFPEYSMAKWLVSDSFKADPIPDFIEKTGETMTWREVSAAVKIPAAQQHYMKLLFQYGLKDSIIVPLFGPNQRNSIAVCMFGALLGENNEALINAVVAIVGATHQKICRLIIRDQTEDILLSKREGEVLHWIAHGKSTPDIATILGISAETVNTYVRRLYTKLGVHDRISAVFEGMSRGLVRL
jgi:DNA-binding CsgD family transcriptional regulator